MDADSTKDLKFKPTIKHAKLPDALVQPDGRSTDLLDRFTKQEKHRQNRLQRLQKEKEAKEKQELSFRPTVNKTHVVGRKDAAPSPTRRKSDFKVLKTQGEDVGKGVAIKRVKSAEKKPVVDRLMEAGEKQRQHHDQVSGKGWEMGDGRWET